MRLTEHEGKELFIAHGIAVPRSELVRPGCTAISLPYPVVLKSQVPVSNRNAHGGVLRVTSAEQFADAATRLFALSIDGHTPEVLLAEEYITAAHELYASFSYSSETRTPVLALSACGGSGVSRASLHEIDLLEGLTDAGVKAAVRKAALNPLPELVEVILKLWELFISEKLLLAEINPLLADGSRLVAGDAKIECDDAMVPPREKELVPLGGDIAIIASGGGASMLNIDMLMCAGGRPANYVEYSGNPPAAVVEALTIRVLSQAGLRGAWVIGGTANFTDTYETMTGFVSGLRHIKPKPRYPIVVRRDGPRQAEAKAMLERVAREEGYQLFVYGADISMEQSAAILLSKI